MKNIIFLLFTSLLVSSLIVGCGGSSGGDDSGSNGDLTGSTKTVMLPGSAIETSTTAKAPGKTDDKPVVKVTPGCEESNLPNCKK